MTYGCCNCSCNFTSQSNLLKNLQCALEELVAHNIGAETNVHIPKKAFWPDALEWLPSTPFQINFPTDNTLNSQNTLDDVMFDDLSSNSRRRNCKKNIHSQSWCQISIWIQNLWDFSSRKNKCWLASLLWWKIRAKFYGVFFFFE